MSRIPQLKRRLAPLREELLDHVIYADIRDVESLRIFMQHHVFAVWDFMSLLKAMQQKLCCQEVPWLPPANRLGCRLVNEIVLAEESDEDGHGGFVSHFELYRNAMIEIGADTKGIDAFLRALDTGESVAQAISSAALNSNVQRFVSTTFDIIDKGDVCGLASAFTFGREILLPDVFVRIVNNLDRSSDGHADVLRYYLTRHIDLDSHEHAPLAERLVENLCGDSSDHWQTAETAAADALKARKLLWDGVTNQIHGRVQTETN